MALPSTKVEIAFNAGFTTASGSRTWTDVSAYVLGQFPVSITRGRQDEVSQAPPSKLSLVLNNIDGRFTPEKTGGAYYPNVKLGRPIRVTVTYNAVNYVRFLGFIDDWAPTWPDGTSADSVTTVTASSRLARLGRDAELRSIVEEEIILDAPTAYYTMGDPDTATTAADSSGNLQAVLTQFADGTAVTFGVATGPTTDGLTAAQFAGGKFLIGTLAAVPLSVEFDFSTTATDGVLYVQGSNKLEVISGQLRLNGSLVTSSINDGATHNVAIELNNLYLDGSLMAPNPVAITGTTFSLGGDWTNYLTTTEFTGVMSHFAAFASTLSAARHSAHAYAAITGFTGEAAGVRTVRYAGYAGVPSGEISADTGLSVIGHVDTTGQAPVELMRRVEKTENGVLYDAKDGTLTFKDRDTRYNAAAAFTLNATSQEVEADLEPKYNDQFQFNDVSAVANGTPAGRAFDATSIADYGYYRETLDTVTDDTGDALAGAQWKVGLGKDPRARYGQVTVDVVNSSTSQAALVLAAEIGTRFDLASLPTQAPATTAELFVEGYIEQITSATHKVQFNTSPTYGYTGLGTTGVWQLGVAGRSELGDTTRLAF